MIELFCSDFDGTFAQGGKVLPENAKAVRALLQTQTAFCLVTGRPLSNAKKLMDAQRIACPIIASNGALVTQDGVTPIAEECIPTEALKEILDFAHRKKWFYIAYERDRCFLPVGIPRFLMRAIGWGIERASGVDTLRERDVDVLQWRITKMNLYPRGASVESALERFQGDTRLYVTTSSDNKIELSAAGVSKWAGIQRLAATLGIEESAIATIGDYDNDVSMLEHAPYSFVIGDGQPAAKAAAKEIVAPVSENGVAEAIRRVMAWNREAREGMA